MDCRMNLLDEPWLPARLATGEVRRVGLLDALRLSSEITALAETSPPSLVAEYRLLLAVAHRALVTALGRWKDSDRIAWHREGLPVPLLCDYLERWRDRFWLFHPVHPFMQVPALAEAEETRDKRKPWTQISLASASGNTPVVFDHALDATPGAIDGAEALTHLLGYLQFTPGGLVKALRDADKAGPLVNTAAVLPLGATLAQTLCLALHKPPVASQPEPDLPAWEKPAPTLAPLRGPPVLATGPNDRYTRLTRAVLLDPDDDGRVRWLRFAAGLALDEDAQRPDPMACYRVGANGLVRVGFVEGRAAWRDLPALVPAPQGAGVQASRAAEVVEGAASLLRMAGPGRQHGSLLVAGVASDQAKLLRWRVERFVLPSALLVEADLARALCGCLALAEELHLQLRRLTTDLVAGALPDPGSKETRARARDLVERGPFSARYFAEAERQLWALMERLAAWDPDGADVLWHRALRAAAQEAWREVVNQMGASASALISEARCVARLNRLLRQLLPAAHRRREPAAAPTPAAPAHLEGA